jgi:hypothetical protein
LFHGGSMQMSQSGREVAAKLRCVIHNEGG